MITRQRVYLSLIIFFLPLSLLAQGWVEAWQTQSNFHAIQDSFNQYWEGKTPEKGRGYKQFKRWEYYWKSRVNEDGTFPEQNIRQLAWDEYLTKHADAQIESASPWTNLGPSSSAGGYIGLGRINCVEFHPSNSSTFWVGTAGGGLWKTTNGGNSWTSLTENLNIDVMSVTGVVVHPSNPNILYMATGDGYGRDTYSVGVYKSTNGGSTWALTGLSWSLSESEYIRKLIINPSNPNILLAGTSEGIYRTSNGGASWTLELSAGLTHDMEFRPSDPDVIYASVNATNSTNSLYRSIDGGLNWTLHATVSDCNRTELAVTPADPNLVMVVGSRASDNGFRGLFASTNSGSTYFTRSTLPNLLGWEVNGSDSGGQGFYDLAIAISPVNANLVYVGGVNIWRSTNGGFSWFLATRWANLSGSNAPIVHADQHDIVFQNSSAMFVCNDGGIYKTTNGGGSFSDLTNGMAISQLYSIGVSQLDNKVLSGLQDNGVKMRSAAGVWTDEVGGDGMNSFISPTNSNVMYSCKERGNRIYRSTNGGGSWIDVAGALPGGGEWVTPMDINPDNGNQVYVGYQAVYTTLNQGSTWAQISPFFSSENLTTLKVAPSNTQVIYTSTDDRLWKTTNGGNNWTELSGALPWSNVNISQIDVHPDNSNIVCITYSGFSNGKKVIRSTNGGSSWTNISGTLPNLPANCLTFHDNGNGSMYLGMDIGVYYRDDDMSDWMLYSDGLPNVEIFDLDIRESTGKLRAASYGRGLWETDVYTQSSGCSAPTGLTAYNIEERSADFSWDAVADADDYTLQVRVQGGSNWIDFTPSSNEYSLVYFDPCSDWEWRVRANCNGTEGDFSGIQSFSTTGCNAYCESFGTDPDFSLNGVDEWIESVSIANVSNTSGNNYGYQDNGNLFIQATQGQNLTATLTPGFGQVGAHNVYWSVWIDFNQDNDFLDAGEQVYVSSPSSGNVTASIIIPSGAMLGQTRMRVAMKKDGPASSCGGYDNGEVEDYGVEITAGGGGGAYCASKGLNTSSDYIARVRLANLNSTSGNENGGYSNFTNLGADLVQGSGYNVTLSPNLPYGNNRWRYWRIWIDYNQDGDFEDSGELVFESIYAFQLPLTGILQVPEDAPTGQTRMRVSMKYVAPSNLIIQGPCDNFSHGEVEDYTVVISPDEAGYCQAAGEFTDYLWIERVKLGSINNFTLANNGYAYFPNASTTVDAGSSYPIELTPGLDSFNIEVFWRVYIDYNQDQDFDDPGELVVQSQVPQFAPLSSTINVPQGAASGETRMRVVMKFVSVNEIFYPFQCGYFLFGEVEDYKIFINGGVAAPVASFSASPLSGQAPLQVQFNDLSTNNPTEWEWDFGDGQTSTLQNPMISYSAPGSYTVSLTVTNAGGVDSETKTAYIVVENPVVCDPPEDLDIVEVGYSYCRAEWTDDPDALQYQTRIRMVGNSTWTTGQQFTNPWRYWANRTPNTTYELQVRKECDSGWSDWSNSEVFTTLGAGDPYCFTYGDGSPGYINSVSFAGINNNSGNDFGYGHYTSQVANTTAGNSYPVTLGSGGLTGTVYWRVYIDLNQDDDFDDPGEQVLQSTGSSATPFQGTIAIPISATPGTTRMRVSMGSNQYPEPCITSAAGMEAEDYSIIISSGAQVPTADFVVSQTCGEVPMTVTFTDASTNNPTSWNWNFGNGQTGTLSQANITFTESGTYTVSLTATNAAGSDTETKTALITVVDPVSITADPGIQSCIGNPVTLEAIGGSNFSWTGTGLSSSTGAQVLASPAAPGTYTYSVTSSVNNCSSSPAAISLTFNSIPQVGLVASSTSACLGTSINLLASGASSYQWSGLGLNSNQGIAVEATPATSGFHTYEVVGTSNGCSSTPVSISLLFEEIPQIQLTISDSTPCLGQSVQFVATGAASYSWSGVGLSSNNGSVVSALPLNPGLFTYTVVGANGDCISSPFSVQLNFVQAPNVNISASASTACVGDSIELSASGATTYDWTGQGLSASTGAQVYASPVLPGSYSYQVTGDLGDCPSAPQSVSLQFEALPNITAQADPSVICLGESSILTVSGATSYTWMDQQGNQFTGNSWMVTPQDSGQFAYTVIGTSGACSSLPEDVEIMVLAVPELQLEFDPSEEFCLGDTLVFSASGADNYFWNGPGLLGFNGQTVHALPQDTGQFSYSLSGIGAGCQPLPLSFDVQVISNPVSGTIEVTGCPGPNLSFVANSVNAGTFPNVLWYLNGNPVWTGNTYTLFGAQNGDQVSATITPVNGPVCYSPSVFTIPAYTVNCIPLSTSELNLDVSATVFPNPNTGEFNLRLESQIASHSILRLLDPLGRLVLQQKMFIPVGVSQHEFQLEGMASGAYSIQIQTEGGMISKQVMIFNR